MFSDAKGYFGRTNNEMEMLALINALLQAAKTDAPVTIVSDSKYVLDSVTNWMYNWQSNGWKKAGGEIANLKGWQQIFDLVQPLENRLDLFGLKDMRQVTETYLSTDC
ncbi:RNase H family protein [Weissella ceti]|uniref:RNase H family protein n=1 Tax=Weissella ceti TaxID=759620 RepID=UPI0004F64497|nr:RNase H family protein [Weissella ceti]